MTTWEPGDSGRIVVEFTVKEVRQGLVWVKSDAFGWDWVTAKVLADAEKTTEERIK